GESQRIKLAFFLSKEKVSPSLFIFDEPTTGLHFDDVRKLLIVLQRLVDEGNTVVVIEHNMDVIQSADWIIDLGPGGGDKGGHIVAAGTPKDVAKVKQSATGQCLKDYHG
ncbi:MAG: excinuclease ABC subunit A, partial [Deltaproteobacteria bacterium]|nr:excinuclease ABC subunit A [Deltaproteobacteria bacterium]